MSSKNYNHVCPNCEADCDCERGETILKKNPDIELEPEDCDHDCDEDDDEE